MACLRRASHALCLAGSRKWSGLVTCKVLFWLARAPVFGLCSYVYVKRTHAHVKANVFLRLVILGVRLLLRLRGGWSGRTGRRLLRLRGRGMGERVRHKSAAAAAATGAPERSRGGQATRYSHTCVCLYIYVYVYVCIYVSIYTSSVLTY